MIAEAVDQSSWTEDEFQAWRKRELDSVKALAATDDSALHALEAVMDRVRAREALRDAERPKWMEIASKWGQWSPIEEKPWREQIRVCNQHEAILLIYSDYWFGFMCQRCQGGPRSYERRTHSDLAGLNLGLAIREDDARSAFRVLDSQWRLDWLETLPKWTRTDLSWQERYSAYLKSELWAARREAVMARDCRLCQACRQRPATEVHHLNYDHVFNEPLFDLVAVCGECHEQITARDKENREAKKCR